MRVCALQSREYGCIFSRGTGPFSLADLKQKFLVMADMDYYRDGAPVFCDMSTVDFTDATGGEMLTAGRVEAAPLRNPAVRKVSLVAGSELAYGQLSVIAQMRSSETHHTRVFRTTSEALSWLAIPGVTDEVPPQIHERIDRVLHDDVFEGDGQTVIVIGDA